MDISKLEQYFEERNRMTAEITASVMNAVSLHLEQLPEDATEEIGSAILTASNEIAETILDILADTEYYVDEEEPDSEQ